MKAFIVFGFLFAFQVHASELLNPFWSSGPTCTTNISDDFSGTLAKWNILSGAWAISDGELTIPAQGVIIYDDEETCSLTQTACVKIVADSGYRYGGPYFRSQNNDSTLAYTVRIQTNEKNVVWRYCTGASCSTLDTWNNEISAGEYLCARVSGVGNATEVDLWDKGLVQPDISNLGPADYTMTADPGANAADVGTYVGMYNGSTNAMQWDDFDAQ